MSCIAIIPARGGSRRIPRKNIKMFHGKPIIAYSIETAMESGLFDKILVSTDSDEIGAVALQHGAEVMVRKPDLAIDEIGTRRVIFDAMKAFPEAYYVCGLYATSPLLNPDDLVRGYKLCLEYNFAHAISVVYPPLQDAGCFYWSSQFAIEQDIEYFDHRTALVKIEPERVCDINTPEDWKRAESMFDKLKSSI